MEKKIDVILRLAKADDLDEIVKLIRELSGWLRTKGVQQWSDAFSRSILEEEISRDELYVLHDKNQIIGTVVLGKDAGELWSDSSAKAIYLSRLAVIRARAGHGLGEAIMSWAERKVQQNGADSLRLVCDASNPFLPTYYKNLGYEPRGSKLYEPWNMTFAMFEKKFR